MARPGAKKAATAKTKIPASSEEKQTITMQYYINGTFKDTPPKPKYNTDTASQTISDHESQESTGVAKSNLDDKLHAEAQKNANIGVRVYTQEEMEAAEALLLLSKQAILTSSSTSIP